MNFIEFNDRSLLVMAVTVLEISGAPAFNVIGGRIYSDDIDEVIDLLHENGIMMFDAPHLEDNERDQFRTDAEADADALASAGMGTDEDYGCFSAREDDGE